ncbi:flagellar hook-length control protein FliK [Pusillimonas sp.]|uniref:flagellar hook-length control protein FliK n=1 Tax=Pusillimonas sp. TaxID=3040095 RepID=UPI0037C7ED4C
MNSPNIAALVPGLKPQAERSAVSTDHDAPQDGSFADVLAGQSSPARGDAHADTAKAAPDDAASGGPPVHGPSTDEPKAQELASDVKDKPEPEDLASALPQIALEIALHAREQARAKTPMAEARNSPDIREGRQSRREVLTAAMQTDAALVQADHVKGNTNAGVEGIPAGAGTNALGLGNAAPGIASADTDRPGFNRPGAHQTDLKPTVSMAALQSKTAARTPAGPADKVATQGELFNAAAAIQNHLESNDPATREARLHSVDLPTVAQPSPANFNPFHPVAGITTAPPVGPAMAITTPMHQSGWNADFGRQVITLARDAHSGAQTAELRLDPPELGPLRITLSLNEGMASALFVSAHASVRQAVEAALPQLSQQLAQAGISLGETHVGDQGQAGFAFNEGGGRPGMPGTGSADGDGGPADSVAAPRRAVAANALVDTFA